LIRLSILDDGGGLTFDREDEKSFTLLKLFQKGPRLWRKVVSDWISFVMSSIVILHY
jgi:hypothetical protein